MHYRKNPRWRLLADDVDHGIGKRGSRRRRDGTPDDLTFEQIDKGRQVNLLSSDLELGDIAHHLHVYLESF